MPSEITLRDLEAARAKLEDIPPLATGVEACTALMQRLLRKTVRAQGEAGIFGMDVFYNDKLPPNMLVLSRPMEGTGGRVREPVRIILIEEEATVTKSASGEGE